MIVTPGGLFHYRRQIHVIRLLYSIALAMSQKSNINIYDVFMTFTKTFYLLIIVKGF